MTMNADAMVYVSFYPSGGSMIPRFAGDSAGDGVLTVEDCVTMLTFQFVSSASGYDTGIVVSNTAGHASGSCTASYSGSEDTMSSPVVEGNSHWIFLVSSHMQDYTGRLEVECDFGGIDGYAQINDHMGNARTATCRACPSSELAGAGRPARTLTGISGWWIRSPL